MVNEEIAREVVNLALRTTNLTGQEITGLIKEYFQKLEQRKLHKTVEPKHGKQSVKKLIGQGEGVTSVDVTKTDLKDFQKIARKYGVDFAIVKDKNNVPPVYTVFFKAKDQDAISNVIRKYMNLKMKRNSRTSVLEKLNEIKKMLAGRLNKQRTRNKEATR